jgi:hypothetical protein
VAGLIPTTPTDYFTRSTPIAGPRFEANRAANAGYYARAAVWLIASTSLENLLKAAPDDIQTRSLYARIACLAGRHAVAAQQFEKLKALGKYDPRYLPGKGEYERFVEAARKGVIDPASLMGKWTAGTDGHVEFTKDGKYLTTDPKGAPAEGRYRLDGNRLTINNTKGEVLLWTRHVDRGRAHAQERRRGNGPGVNAGEGEVARHPAPANR